MRSPKDLRSRLEDQADSRAKLQERLRKLASTPKPISQKKEIGPPIQEMPSDQAPEPVSAPAPNPAPVFAPPSLLNAEGALPLKVQPWTARLVNTLLSRAQDKKLSLRLLWPAEPDNVALLHGMASVSEVIGANLPGLRTVVFPGTRATWTALDTVAVSLGDLSATFRKIVDRGIVTDYRPCGAMQAVLDACNHLYTYSKEQRSAQLRQLMPSFFFNDEQCQWQTNKHAPLNRLLAKLLRNAIRDELRGKTEAAWYDPQTAPAALFVLPHGIKKKVARKAVSADSLGKPADVLLLDARRAATKADPGLVRRMPGFVKTLREGAGDIGGLVVTDDPTLFLVLRAAFSKAELAVDAEVLAAEPENLGEELLAEHPRIADWAPPQRASVNFTTYIIDKEAAMLARKFGKFAEDTRVEGEATEVLFRLAQGFLLRMSHLPGGTVDLVSEDSGEQDYLNKRLDWAPIDSQIQAALASGSANEHRAAIEASLARVRRHLADLRDETPVAAKLLELVQRFTSGKNDGLAVVMQSQRGIQIAKRFLRRRLAERFDEVDAKLEWVPLASAPEALKCRTNGSRLVVVGLAPSTIRLLCTSNEVPTGTWILLPLQRAVGVVGAMNLLCEADSLKPYRTRIAGLRKSLTEQIATLPPDLASYVKKDELEPPRPRTIQSTSEVPDSKAYTFELEDGSMTSSSGMVFVYKGDEDPPFRRVQARSVKQGDLLFDMSDELRDEVEEAIRAGGDALDTSSPEKKLVLLYRRGLANTVARQFPAESRSAAARKIIAAMTKDDPAMADVSVSKVSYWISPDENDKAPHGARDQQEYFAFCNALGISRPMAALNWETIRLVRFQNQTDGRRLKAFYAEILFAAEDVAIYRHIPRHVIARLQGRAVDNLYAVVRVTEPRDQ